MESHFHSEVRSLSVLVQSISSSSTQKDAPQFSTMSEEMQEDERAGESILYNAYSRLLRG